MERSCGRCVALLDRGPFALPCPAASAVGLTPRASAPWRWVLCRVSAWLCTCPAPPAPAPQTPSPLCAHTARPQGSQSLAHCTAAAARRGLRWGVGCGLRPAPLGDVQRVAVQEDGEEDGEQLAGTAATQRSEDGQRGVDARKAAVEAAQRRFADVVMVVSTSELKRRTVTRICSAQQPHTPSAVRATAAESGRAVAAVH